MFNLSGKIAVVTGGGSGIGLAMAQALAGHGAHVVLVGRDLNRLEAAVVAIEEDGGAAEPFVCNLLDSAAIAVLIQEIEAKCDGIDILLNNAGIQHRDPIVEFSNVNWHRVIDTNLTAPFQLVRAAVPGMIRRGGGKIINTLSVLSSLGRANVVPYAAAKGGLQMLTRGLAVELAKDNVQVNGIAPGYILTEMNTALAEDATFSAWLTARTPAARWGQPQELGGAAVFLASPASDFVTGHVLQVDGGLMASV